MARFAQVTIIGVGLMGGSLGLALRQRDLATAVVGVDRQADTLAEAVAVGAIDRGTTDLADGVKDADCVVMAVPVGIISELMEQIAPFVSPNALVTDLGSVKQRIVAAGTRWFGTRFVGGHPMAGSEQSGVSAARADLFEGAAWAIVRPTPFAFDSDTKAAQAAALARALGAKPVALDAAQHDRLVALVSHLPHALSFSFAQLIGSHPEAEVAQSLAAGSYRDMMRVSRSDPALWRDIFLDNRDALLIAIHSFSSQLDSLQRSIEAGDSEALLALLQRPFPS